MLYLVILVIAALVAGAHLSARRKQLVQEAEIDALRRQVADLLAKKKRRTLRKASIPCVPAYCLTDKLRRNGGMSNNENKSVVILKKMRVPVSGLTEALAAHSVAAAEIAPARECTLNRLRTCWGTR